MYKTPSPFSPYSPYQICLCNFTSAAFPSNCYSATDISFPKLESHKMNSGSLNYIKYDKEG